ncbi:MAG: hypothetical protein ACFB4I_21175 [Cyanophyceae cyanobacterium]
MLMYLWHGPYREPLSLEPGIEAFNSSATIPYFGIIPRGLLNRLELQPWQHPHEWNRIAPWLELGLSAVAADEWKACLDKVDFPESDRLQPWLTVAKEVGVLSLQTTAKLCVDFLSSLLSDQKAVSHLVHQLGYGEDFSEEISRVDVWLVKEGQTSSVWRIELHSEAFYPSLVFCLNVARDSEAGRELVDSYAHLVNWYARDPTHVAKPLCLETVETNLAGRTISLAMTLHAWIDGRELHGRPGRNGSAAFIEVEWFVPEHSQNQESLRVLGRILSATEHQQLWAQLLKFYRRHATYSTNGAEVVIPGLEINDGDLVWTGQEIVAVAASATSSALSLQAWQEFMVNPSLRLGTGGAKAYRFPKTTSKLTTASKRGG